MAHGSMGSRSLHLCQVRPAAAAAALQRQHHWQQQQRQQQRQQQQQHQQQQQGSALLDCPADGVICTRVPLPLAMRPAWRRGSWRCLAGRWAR